MIVSQSAIPADPARLVVEPLQLSTVRPTIGVNQITTYHWSLAQEIPAYRNAGFDTIGLWLPKLYEFGEQQAETLLAESELAVSSLSWVGGFTGYNGYPLAEAMQEVYEGIDLAARLRAGCLVVSTGPRAGHTKNHARQLVVDAMVELSDYAGQRGVHLALQPVHRRFAQEWSFLNTIEQTRDLIACCDHSNLGLAFDVYHFWQESRLFEQITDVAQQTWVVQLSDGCGSMISEMDRSLPGTGEIPLSAIMAAFQQAGFEGAFELNVWSDEVWQSDYVELLKESCGYFQDMLKPNNTLFTV